MPAPQPNSPFTLPDSRHEMLAMLKSSAWLLAPLMILCSSTLNAQETPASTTDGTAVDTISPVPAPEISPGDGLQENLVMPENLNITNGSGEISGNIETGIRFCGPVKIVGDNGLEIFSRTAVLDLKTKTVTLEDDVSIYQGNMLQRGDRAIYHYDTKNLESDNLRASIDPILLESGKFTVEQQGDRKIFIGKDAGITTHDVEDPNFWMRAKETRVYPGDKVVFKNLTAYAGDVPVLWLPYLSQPLDSELGYHFIPGSTSSWGPYLLNTYGIMLGGERDPITGDTNDAWLLSRWRFDLMATRGVGMGLDLVEKDSARDEEIPGLSLYYINDLDPSYSRTGVVRNPVSADRYKVEFKHRTLLDFGDDADWRLDANISHYGDEYFLEDFAESFYRRNPAPDNTLGLYRRDDSSLFSVLGRYQLNDFYRSDTRLPEAIFDVARTPLFDLPLFDLPIHHEGTFSLGMIGERAADGTSTMVINPLSALPPGDPQIPGLLAQLSGYERALAEEMVNLLPGDPRREEIRQQLNDASYLRLHAYEQFSMPMMIGDFLSLTPQAGFGYTRYGAVDGPGDGFGRPMFHLGTEASMKFSKDLGDIRNRALGIDGLMHIMQPYATWSMVSTDDFIAGSPGVDRLSPTTRPRTLDPMRFSAIDQLESWNIIRVGARNRLLTRRDGQSFSLLYLNTYIDAFSEDPEGDRSMSNLHNDVLWQPVPWLTIDTETQFPIADGGSGFSELYSRAIFLPTDKFEFSIAYRWLNGHPFLRDSSLISLSTYSRLNENWGIGTRHVFEMDDKVLEQQYYTLHRDLGNWVAGVGLSSRDNRLKEEYGVLFTLTLKDFPSVSLPFSYDGE